MENEKKVYISNQTAKRLLHDVKNIMKNPLEDDGIYYKHDETNIMKGYALIVGPSDTVYEYGYYLFEIDYPDNYPHSPPVFTYYTNDCVTRFNPNLYRNGKVCLSILNTWRGEGWTSCQTISSVLLTVCTILCKNPLLNEPGITINHKDLNKYNDIIKYKNIEVAILGLVESPEKYIGNKFTIFKELMEKLFLVNYENIHKSVENGLDIFKKTKTITTSIYNLEILIDYQDVFKKLKRTYHRLEKKNNVNLSDKKKSKKVNTKIN